LPSRFAFRVSRLAPLPLASPVAEYWDLLLDYLRAAPPTYIYIFLFVGSFMENVVPLIPGDTLIVFGAYLAGIGIIQLWPAYFLMWAGSAVGCLLIYGIAYTKGRDWFQKWEPRIFSNEHLQLGERWFIKHGQKIVIFNRFLPTVRAFVGVVAGLSRMHPARMSLYVILGTLLWNSLLVYFGLMVGENWALVVSVLRTYNRIILVLLVIGGAAWYIRHRRRKHAKPPTPS